MKTAFELEKEFVEHVKEKTGHELDHWMKQLKKQSLSKMKETVDFLKNEKGVSHMNATFIAGIFLNDGELVNDPTSLLKKHFEGKSDKKELYERIVEVVKSEFANVQIVPTKGYISFRHPKEFAIAKINNKEIRVGLDLGEKSFNDYTQKAKSLGTMPRISHMVEVTSIGQVDDRLKEALVEANHIVNTNNS